MKNIIFKSFVFLVVITIIISCAVDGKKEDIENIPVSQKVEIIFSFSGEGNLYAKIGSKKIESGDKIKRGSLIVFTAEPKEKFSVDGWMKNGQNLEDLKGKRTAKFKADSDLNVSVAFTKSSKKISFSSNAGGEVTAEINGNKITSGGLYKIDNEVLFKASNKEGYKIAVWEINKNKLENSENKTNHTMLISDNIFVKVTFEKLKFPVNFTAKGEGHITASISSGSIENGGLVEFDKKVTFEAFPDEKAEIDSWLLNGKPFPQSGKKKKVSLRVKNETTVVVVFKSKK